MTQRGNRNSQTNYGGWPRISPGVSSYRWRKHLLFTTHTTHAITFSGSPQLLFPYGITEMGVSDAEKDNAASMSV